ncbi:MAG TPA: AAA domain-containing protein [Methylotenera sp.]|nr:AAA domain-containing protein [Methylotenera sp.]HPN01039.1 AAA domain-containing protein [Methylotenera sp.]
MIANEQSRDDWFKSKWQEYTKHYEKLLSEVADKDALSEFELADYFFIVKKEVISPSMHIRALYADIIKNKPETPLFERYSSDTIHPPEPCIQPNALFSGRLAHSGNKFSLAAAQRDALNHLMVSSNGDILAVNGPPGTGKTTLLLSVVASAWAKAAIEGGNPPVIFASSTNNQAVTNIIEAFEKDFSMGEGVFAGRWLPDIKSFGAYFPAANKEAESAKKYQTKLFFDKVEDEAYIKNAEQHFVAAAKKAFPSITDYSIKFIVAALQAAIQNEANKLKSIESAWITLLSARENLLKELGTNPSEEMHKRKHDVDATLEHMTALKALENSWEAYLAAEPLFYSLFSWIPPVKTKRLLLAKQFLKNNTDEKFEFINTISVEITQKITKTRLALEKFQVSFTRGAVQMQAMRASNAGWANAVAPLKSSIPADDLTLQQCDALADTSIRFDVFLLTTHYWEGRWLIAMNDLLTEHKGNLSNGKGGEKAKNGQYAMEKRWYRRMMLTPCAVSTFFMLPKELLSKRHNEGIFDDDYLYNFADLLIVDEAGQVLPEVAGASFALAKMAMVIGDTKQIEPIWSITKQIDVGNMVAANMLPKKYNEETYNKLADLGKVSSSGSVMRIAQHATRYHYDPDLARGMFLFEHHRCFNEIISYCNELCYSNKLKPKRGSPENYNGLPTVGYLHVNGICQNSNGSRKNDLEAQTIAEWLLANKKQLESTHKKPLNEIVGIVAPFTGQVRAISTACKARGIAVGQNEGELTVGTVHSLQGAERLVVIFSPTYSKHADGKFIDNNQSMLNVAVSRAKDNFLVFGDMDIFDSSQRGKPRGLLASYLFRNESNALSFKYLPRQDLKNSTPIRQLVNSDEHDSFLIDVFKNSHKKVIIVTPWLLPHSISADALATMASAIQRGVSITVYTDTSFNKSRKNEMHEAVALLKSIGVKTLLVKNVHSKIVICDDATYCAGSFNWFSADRHGQYKNYEISIAYQGNGLAKEIDIIKNDLLQRVVQS